MRPTTTNPPARRLFVHASQIPGNKSSFNSSLNPTKEEVAAAFEPDSPKFTEQEKQQLHHSLTLLQKSQHHTTPLCSNEMFSDLQQEATNEKSIIFSSIKKKTNSPILSHQNPNSNDELTTHDSNDELSVPETIQTSALTPQNDPHVQGITQVFEPRTVENKQKDKDSKPLKKKPPKTPKKKKHCSDFEPRFYVNSGFDLSCLVSSYLFSAFG